MAVPESTQFPAPSQRSLGCSVVPEQVWVTHTVPATKFWHVLEPLHVAQEPHSFSGSNPAPMGVQVPSPETLHTSQVPLHAVEQQTPSTQLPERHCPALVQVSPPALLFTHTEPLHHAVGQQSVA